MTEFVPLPDDQEPTQGSLALFFSSFAQFNTMDRRCGMFTFIGGNHFLRGDPISATDEDILASGIRPFTFRCFTNAPVLFAGRSDNNLRCRLLTIVDCNGLGSRRQNYGLI